MSATITIFLLLLAIATTTSCSTEPLVEAVRTARTMVAQSMNIVKATLTLQGLDHTALNHHAMGVSDCVKLYDESDHRLSLLLSQQVYGLDDDDVRTWLSGVLSNHMTCLDGLGERGFFIRDHVDARNLTTLLREALALSRKSVVRTRKPMHRSKSNQAKGLLTHWNPAASKSDFVVAKDGSGTYKTIKGAVAAVSRMGNNRPERVIIHVKEGVYNEQVDIDHQAKKIMMVGDGMDKTIITGRRNVPDGYTTYGSATFGVSGDGFWAKDMTFENAAGPSKHQAVAIRVSSDMSVFYRCSFRGYQDTLFVHSERQFYRDCHIYGTIDFIFGNAAAFLQNCGIFLRKPMNHQANMITAQGREDPNENTGISIHRSRVRPALDFNSVKYNFESYLGRPWKKYSRTVFMKTDLDGMIDPEGWSEWNGSFALSTLYYAEFGNTGSGASTGNRVNWPGFHVLNSSQQAAPFMLNRLVQGQTWIPETGVPFSTQI